jgi:hypothetical protein
VVSVDEQEFDRLHDDVLILQTNVKGIEVAFIDFRAESRDEIKWIRRMLIGTLASAIIGSFFASTVAVLVR